MLGGHGTNMNLVTNLSNTLQLGYLAQIDQMRWLGKT